MKRKYLWAELREGGRGGGTVYSCAYGAVHRLARIFCKSMRQHVQLNVECRRHEGHQLLKRLRINDFFKPPCNLIPLFPRRRVEPGGIGSNALMKHRYHHKRKGTAARRFLCESLQK